MVSKNKGHASSEGVVTKDIGDSGGHSPPAMASSSEKGGRVLCDDDDKLSPVCGGSGGTLNMGLIFDFADFGVFPKRGECP